MRLECRGPCFLASRCALARAAAVRVECHSQPPTGTQSTDASADIESYKRPRHRLTNEDDSLSRRSHVNLTSPCQGRATGPPIQKDQICPRPFRVGSTSTPASRARSASPASTARTPASRATTATTLTTTDHLACCPLLAWRFGHGRRAGLATPLGGHASTSPPKARRNRGRIARDLVMRTAPGGTMGRSAPLRRILHSTAQADHEDRYRRRSKRH